MITKYNRLRQKIKSASADPAEAQLFSKLVKAQRFLPRLINKSRQIIKLISS